MIREFSRTAIIMCFVVASGCRNDSNSQTASQACLPLEVQQILAASRAAVDRLQPASAPEMARLYIDGSGSMSGFVQAPGRSGTPFGDVIQSIGSSTIARRLELYRLGDREPVRLGNANAARISALQSPDFYHCRGPETGPNCTFQQSRTQVALRAMADAPPDVTSIFISDLWFSANEVTSDPGIEIREALATILRDRDILIYGFNAPYAGALSDLPSRRRDVRPSRTPFYMLVVGPRAGVHQFHNQFKESGSTWIRERLAARPGSPIRGELNFALFSRVGSFSRAPTIEFRANDPHRGIADAMPWRELREAIPQQFEVQGEAASPLVWDGASRMAEEAAWQGRFEARILAWQIHDPSTCQRAQQVRVLSEVDEASLTMSLDPQVLRRELGRGTWLIAGEIQRENLVPDSPAVRWMNGWSFPSSVAGESLAVQQMAETNFFPTMNLANFAVLLQQAVADARQPAGATAAPFAGFATVISIR